MSTSSFALKQLLPNAASQNTDIDFVVAGLLRLHREETYNLPANATTEEIVKAEIARRTFWVLESMQHYVDSDLCFFPATLISY